MFIKTKEKERNWTDLLHLLQVVYESKQKCLYEKKEYISMFLFHIVIKGRYGCS